MNSTKWFTDVPPVPVGFVVGLGVFPRTNIQEHTKHRGLNNILGCFRDGLVTRFHFSTSEGKERALILYKFSTVLYIYATVCRVLYYVRLESESDPCDRLLREGIFRWGRFSLADRSYFPIMTDFATLNHSNKHNLCTVLYSNFTICTFVWNDAFAAYEQTALDWLQTHQQDIRADVYNGLSDCLF